MFGVVSSPVKTLPRYNLVQHVVKVDTIEDAILNNASGGRHHLFSTDRKLVDVGALGAICERNIYVFAI